jgi:hypothetical protein
MGIDYYILARIWSDKVTIIFSNDQQCDDEPFIKCEYYYKPKDVPYVKFEEWLWKEPRFHYILPTMKKLYAILQVLGVANEEKFRGFLESLMAAC